MVNENRKAFVYVRVSTKRQGEEGTSLTTQEDLCNASAEHNGVAVPPENEVFEEGSGADPLRLGHLRL